MAIVLLLHIVFQFIVASLVEFSDFFFNLFFVVICFYFIDASGLIGFCMNSFLIVLLFLGLFPFVFGICSPYYYFIISVSSFSNAMSLLCCCVLFVVVGIVIVKEVEYFPSYEL